MKEVIGFIVILVGLIWYGADSQDKYNISYLKENCIGDYVLSDDGRICYIKYQEEVYDTRNEYQFKYTTEQINIMNRFN